MRYLFDTHAIVWARSGDARLGAQAERVIASNSAEGFAIADISLLEVSLLLEKKRIESSLSTIIFLERMIAGMRTLPITVEIAALAVRIPLPPADPFDRLIVSTAIEHQLVLITRDRAIQESGLVETVW